jgi:Domain of Unknown Function with PDB structure (DUF3857)
VLRINPVKLLFVLCLLPAAASAGVPDWLRSVAQQPLKTYADDVNAVVLLDDQETVVKDNGDIVNHGRLVYRILRPEGKSTARLSLGYGSETKINYLRGWSMTAKGQEYEAKDKDSIEVSMTTFEVFSDARRKILSVPGADVGTVIGFEFEQRQRPYLFEDEWEFQGEYPVVKSRYTLRLPASWDYRSNWINHSEQGPVEQNGAHVWEIFDVPRIESEYHEPPRRALAGRMLVAFYSEKVKVNTYKSWNDLAAWHAQLIANSFDVSPELQQRVRELAPSDMPMLDRIRALARFAQHDVRYAAIEVGIGGLRPHAASEVFAHRYGDCKDKATVLSTMLAQIGVKSFYMPIYDERGIYTEKTPPNLGFNHVILAIQIPPGTASLMPAVMDHPKLGKLLIFDPTNNLVPFGQLPYYEQDSFALLVNDKGGELVHLPVSSPELNKFQRTAKLKLMPDGSLQGEVEEVRSGFRAMEGREYLQNRTDHDRKKIIEYFLGSDLSNFQVESFDLQNANDIDKDLVLRYKFTASRYAKSAGPLLLVRPRVVGEMAGAFDGTKPRHYAYEFDAPFLSSDSIEIALPDGFQVDELPDPAKAVYPFAEYKSKTEAAGNVLRYTREYKMGTTLVPVEHVDQLKRVFAQIAVDEKNMAVLKKAN